MTLVQVFILLSVLVPRPAVYVRGHSEAADKVRASLGTLTCYTSGTEPESSTAILQVDHIRKPLGGRSWVVIVLTDDKHHVLYERKAEEYPWPLPSSTDRLLRSMAKSTCPAYQRPPLERSRADQHQEAFLH